ncbi:XK-related protein 8-like [Tachysurus ichikawai]
MEEGFPFQSTFPDVTISFLSLIFFLLDLALDLWAVVGLYNEGRYFSMGLLIFLLVGASILTQIFSWIWYSDPVKTAPVTKGKRFNSRHCLLAWVHIFQLGLFFRFGELIMTTIHGYKQHDLFEKGVTVYLNHDLSMLRLFEAFSENAPQLVFMIALTVEMEDQQLFTVAKIVGSLSSLSFTVLSYHRSMRKFIPEKLKMGWSSSVFYFLWNLLLIGPRVVSMSLFASELPCYIAAHFLSLWTLLVLWAWWQKTDFMESKAGEWLYRATVGIIWYFSWFNVVSGSTKHKAVIYHVVMGTDTTLLIGLWWWKRSVESARLSPLPINPYLLIALLVTIYSIGVLLKLVYYWKFHPNKPVLKIRVAAEDKNPVLELQGPLIRAANIDIEVDSGDTPVSSPSSTVTPPTQRNLTGIHKRMKIMAENFYY